MYKDTVTLFNRRKGTREQGDTWYPSVLRNVNLLVDKAAVLSKYGADASDNAVLNVRYQVTADFFTDRRLDRENRHADYGFLWIFL